ncbi:helix-turn-helix transcriptional regulator [Azospirillum sp.]|uniref:helix-turn-helix transcriptional regulator n=1 Tax=Azospirillum sp. TaxID=34012 RepID=UPI002D44FE5A|nr:helix-turn-helix transcriptional regulator [Azospirillum sp.]HYD65425.1 helix-turn-helix transcriptional regulator [Azospirillum sp.]
MTAPVFDQTLFDQTLMDRTGTLVESLGGAAFDRALADVLTSAAEFQQVIVFAVPREGEARCLYGWHRSAPGLAAALSQRYVEGRFDRLDPTLRYLRRITGQPRKLRLLRRDDIDDAAYRRHFFDRPDLDRKVSILNEDSAEGLYLNVYKRAGDADFSDREVGNLAGLSGLVCKSILRHRALTRSHPPAPALPNPIPPDLATLRRLLSAHVTALSAREVEVCARIVAGYSSEGIALDLRVTGNSVATYRKRAYAKLGISSQHELFALCLRAAVC